MKTDRRKFLELSAAAGGAFALSAFKRRADPMRADIAPASTPLRILILGGTGLTGPFQVRYALARGHHVTVFNRGRNNDRLPDGVSN